MRTALGSAWRLGPPCFAFFFFNLLGFRVLGFWGFKPRVAGKFFFGSHNTLCYG